MAFPGLSQWLGAAQRTRPPAALIIRNPSAPSASPPVITTPITRGPKTEGC